MISSSSLLIGKAEKMQSSWCWIAEQGVSFSHQSWGNFSFSCPVAIVVVWSLYSSRELTEQTWWKNMHPLWKNKGRLLVTCVCELGRSPWWLVNVWRYSEMVVIFCAYQNPNFSGVGLRTPHHSSAVTKDHFPLAKSTSPRLAILGGCKVPVSPQRISGFWVGGRARQKKFHITRVSGVL